MPYQQAPRHLLCDFGLARLFDFASPSTRCDATLFDERLKAFQVALYTPLDDPQSSPNILDEAFRVIVHLQHDAGGIVINVVERHHTSVLGAFDTRPGDALVGRLLGYFGAPLLVNTRNFRVSVERFLIDLFDAFYAIHEQRELFELRPLIVSGIQRDIDINCILIRTHKAITYFEYGLYTVKIASRGKTPMSRLLDLNQLT